MSVSFDAILVVGVKLKDVFTVKNETNEVTKYDPDTGQPYFATKTKTVLHCFDQPVAWAAAIDEISSFSEADELQELEVFSCHSEDRNAGEMILGLPVLKAEASSGQILEVKSGHVESKRAEVLDKLTQLNGGQPPQVKTGLYLIPYVSY